MSSPRARLVRLRTLLFESADWLKLPLSVLSERPIIISRHNSDMISARSHNSDNRHGYSLCSEIMWPSEQGDIVYYEQAISYIITTDADSLQTSNVTLCFICADIYELIFCSQLGIFHIVAPRDLRDM